MRNNSGSFHVWRKWKENPLLIKHPNRIALWLTLLDFATWKDQDKYVIHGKNKIQLKLGQLITSSKELSNYCGLSESGIDKILKIFEKDGMCTNETTNLGRCISITNYGNYQYKEERSKNGIGTEWERSKNGVGHTKNLNKVNKVNKEEEELHPHTPERIPEPVVVVETKSIIQRDRERHLGREIKTPEQLIEYWYDILNLFGIQKIDDINGNSGKIDWAASNDILTLRKVELKELNGIIWDFAVEKFLDVRSKHNYVKKTNISNVFTSLSYVCRYLRGKGVVGYNKENKKTGIIFD